MSENWELIKSTNSELSTIPVSLIDKISKKDWGNFKPSYVSKIINRSIAEEHYRRYVGREGIRRGHYIENPELVNGTSGANMKFTRGNSSITYRTLSSPSMFGESAMDAFDKKFASLDMEILTEEQVLRLAVLASIVVGTAHPFPDAHGRTAVGLADVILRRYSQKKLDLTKLEKIDSREEGYKLSMALGNASISMLPDRYNPENILKKLEAKGGGEKIVDVPNTRYDELDQVQTFLIEYSKSISRYIKQFPVNSIANHKINPTFVQSLDAIVQIYRKCLQVNK